MRADDGRVRAKTGRARGLRVYGRARHTMPALFNLMSGPRSRGNRGPTHDWFSDVERVAGTDNLAAVMDAPFFLPDLMMMLTGIHTDNSQFLAAAATVIEAIARTGTHATRELEPSACTALASL